MAGHSKWANIKHRKERQDAKRGKIFTKWIRELTVAAKQGGADPASNPRLRLALDKALGANMSRDIIDRAVARGAGTNESDNVEELSYEGYGPGGVAIMVEAMTDNRNRTAAAVRHAFTKCGGNLGTDGSVAYLFERKGQISFAPGVDEDALMELLWRPMPTTSWPMRTVRSRCSPHSTASMPCAMPWKRQASRPLMRKSSCSRPPARSWIRRRREGAQADRHARGSG